MNNSRQHSDNCGGNSPVRRAEEELVCVRLGVSQLLTDLEESLRRFLEYLGGNVWDQGDSGVGDDHCSRGSLEILHQLDGMLDSALHFLSDERKCPGKPNPLGLLYDLDNVLCSAEMSLEKATSPIRNGYDNQPTTISCQELTDEFKGGGRTSQCLQDSPLQSISSKPVISYTKEIPHGTHKTIKAFEDVKVGKRPDICHKTVRFDEDIKIKVISPEISSSSLISGSLQKQTSSNDSDLCEQKTHPCGKVHQEYPPSEPNSSKTATVPTDRTPHSDLLPVRTEREDCFPHSSPRGKWMDKLNFPVERLPFDPKVTSRSKQPALTFLSDGPSRISLSSRCPEERGGRLRSQSRKLTSQSTPEERAKERSPASKEKNNSDYGLDCSPFRTKFISSVHLSTSSLRRCLSQTETS